MARDANVFYLKNKDWKPLEILFKAHEDYTLQNKVAIYEALPNTARLPFGSFFSYVLVSISDKGDKIIIDFGGEPILVNDLLIFDLKNNNKVPLFGANNLMSFLMWPLEK